MRHLFVLIMFFIAVSGAIARQPVSGYRGFIEWDNSITSYDEYYPGNRVTYYYTGVSTSHGYQINSHVFVGAGLAVHYCPHDDTVEIPLFLHVRTDQKYGSFTPFADLRGGYTLTDGAGWNLSPTVGYRINWGRKTGLDIGVGLTVKGRTIECFTADYDQVSGMWNLGYMGRKQSVKAMFTFRVGFDF